MPVTPMDLQVLFMQESSVSREAERMRRFPEEVRNRLGRRTVAESLRETVDEAEAAEAKVIDEEEGQRPPNYLFRTAPRHRNPEETENDQPQEEGKGAQIDLKA